MPMHIIRMQRYGKCLKGTLQNVSTVYIFVTNEQKPQFGGRNLRRRGNRLQIREKMEHKSVGGGRNKNLQKSNINLFSVAICVRLMKIFVL